MLVGSSSPDTENCAPLPKICCDWFANGTTSAFFTRLDSAASQSGQPFVPTICDALATSLLYAASLMLAKFCPFGAAGPERNATSWSGELTLTGTQEMSQFPVLNSVCTA